MTSALLVIAILAGSLVGFLSTGISETIGSGIDRTVWILIFLLAPEIPFRATRPSALEFRFVAIAWITNFVVIPPLGFLLASIFLVGEPLAATGLVIYFMAPCTDWFLGFTRLARGNTALGSILIPINIATQLALYPLYLMLFTRWQTDLDLASGGETIWQWFLLPFGAAMATRLILPRMPVLGSIFSRQLPRLASLIPVVIALLVFEVFAFNINTIADHATVFARILLAVFSFFLLTYLATEWVSHRMSFRYPEHALYTMTTAARNAPLMLGVTIAAIPDQPLIYAAIVIGMLVEFPHLTLLKHALLRQQIQRSRRPVVSTTPARQADQPGGSERPITAP